MKKFISFSAVSSLFIMAGLVLSLGFASSEVGAQDEPTVEFVDVSKPQSEPHPHFTVTSSSNIFSEALVGNSGFPDSPILIPGDDQPVTDGYCTVHCGGGTAMTCGCPDCDTSCHAYPDFMNSGGYCDVLDGVTFYSYSCGAWLPFSP